MWEHLSASSKVAAEVSISQLALGGCERWWRGRVRLGRESFIFGI